MPDKAERLRILEHWQQEDTEEMLKIWRVNNTEEWSASTIEIIGIVLKERGVELPPQREHVPKKPFNDFEDAWFDYKALRLLMSLGMALLALFCFFNVWIFLMNDNNIIIKIVLVLFLCPLALTMLIGGVGGIFRVLFGKAIGIDDKE